jgi:excisionase family DNA binding protein
MNLVTIKQAAESLSVHPNTIRNWIRAGKIKATRFGPSTIRIAKEQLEGETWTLKN